MNRAAAEVFTVEDYRAMPEGPPYYQLIEGELVMDPSPNDHHQVIVANVFRILDAYLQRKPIGFLRFAPLDVYLSETTIVQPDLFYASHAKKTFIEPDGFHGGPDLVVEVVSPRDGQLEKRRKRALYARHGVKEEWLIEPTLEQIHRYDFTTDTAKPVRIVDSEESFESPLLPDLVINATDVFKR